MSDQEKIQRNAARINTWEIMCIVHSFNKAVEGTETWFDEYKEIEELYAQAIRLQCSTKYGRVMTTDDFIEEVRGGHYTDCDGAGQFADFDGRKREYIRCDVKWLLKNGCHYPFVLWYNK